MSDTIGVACDRGARLNILDHLDLVECVLRQQRLHRHHEADEYRSAGFYTFARLAATGHADHIEDASRLRCYLIACIRNDFNNVHRKLAMPHRRFVQESPEVPLGFALASREIAPDRMAMLREEHDLDHLDLGPAEPPKQPRTSRRLTPADRRTIARIVDDNPTWGLKKVTRHFRELTGLAVSMSTVRLVRIAHRATSADRDRSMGRAMAQPRWSIGPKLATA